VKHLVAEIDFGAFEPQKCFRRNDGSGIWKEGFGSPAVWRTGIPNMIRGKTPLERLEVGGFLQIILQWCRLYSERRQNNTLLPLR